MIKYFVEGTHLFTKISVGIQFVFWLNLLGIIILVLICPYLPLGSHSIIFFGIFPCLVVILFSSPFIALILNIISVVLDTKKGFAIVLLSGNILLIGFTGYIAYLFVSFFSNLPN
jgi:hypothetical protein